MSDKLTVDVDFLEDKLFKILVKEHKESPKHQIKRYPSNNHPERLNCACPICGDSSKSAYKKRGNLYVKNTMFVCYNCDTRMSFIKLCDTFDEQIDLDQRLKLYEYIDANLTYSKSNDYALTALDKLITFDEWVEYMNKKKNSWLVDLKPIEPNSRAFYYLKYERSITNYENIYQAVYRVVRDDKIVFKTDVIVNLNKGGDKLIGIQLRNLEQDKNKRFYKIVEFEELYNYYNNDMLDPVEAIMYNKLSHFYNILNVNFDRTVTVFEGFLDSLFYPNSVGLVGANNDEDILNFLTEADEGISLNFFYDNDDKGIEKAQKMIKKGFSVFLWEKLFSTLLKRSKTPEKYKKVLGDIKDLNDLVLVSKKPNVYSVLKLRDYFSTDAFDIAYLKNIKKTNKILPSQKQKKEIYNFDDITFDSLRKTI